MKKRILLAGLCALALSIWPESSAAEADNGLPTIADARMLSPFGGRANVSPNGKRIVFVGKTYGDAYELEIATGKLRNLTAGFPHQGIMRIQYLPSGDFLVTAPRILAGANTRAHLEMWVLAKDLERGLQPLGEQVFEGIANSKRRNLIAWTMIEPEMAQGENWQLGFARPTKRYVAEVRVVDGMASLANKREIMPGLPEQCRFIEPQDFRANDSELVYSCMGFTAGGGILISVMGNSIAEDRNVTYYRKEGEYNEVEGIAPDGSWAAVECGKQEAKGLPELDICRLELEHGGSMTRLVRGVVPGSTSDISNPVVTPDGKSLIFQRSDSAAPDIGEGYGIYILPLGP